MRKFCVFSGSPIAADPMVDVSLGDPLLGGVASSSSVLDDSVSDLHSDMAEIPSHTIDFDDEDIRVSSAENIVGTLCS